MPDCPQEFIYDLNVEKLLPYIASDVSFIESQQDCLL